MKTTAKGDEKRCPQCYKSFPLFAFLKTDGAPGRQCQVCRRRYSNWDAKKLAEKLAGKEPRNDAAPIERVIWAPISGNKKTGPIPVSMSERGTCPPSCSFYEAGCYADYGKLSIHWRKLGVGGIGLAWRDFLTAVRALPTGQLWRHNEAGDLPGQGQTLDRKRLFELVSANRGRRGWTYSHKHAGASRLDKTAIERANTSGFTINLSADSLEEADALARNWKAPVTVVLPHDAPDRGNRTPEGRRIVVCPAQTVRVTCQECRLCAHPGRIGIVGFKAHGQFARHIPELVKLRRSKLEEAAP